MTPSLRSKERMCGMILLLSHPTMTFPGCTFPPLPLNHTLASSLRAAGRRRVHQLYAAADRRGIGVFLLCGQNAPGLRKDGDNTSSFGFHLMDRQVEPGLGGCK